MTETATVDAALARVADRLSARYAGTADVVAQALAETGVGIRSRTLTVADIGAAKVIVTVGADAGPVPAGKHYLDRPITDPAGADLAGADLAAVRPSSTTSTTAYALVGHLTNGACDE